MHKAALVERRQEIGARAEGLGQEGLLGGNWREH
jgi:hypothetical protein